MALRILHVIQQIGVGGCEKQLLEICRRLEKSEFSLSLCYYAPNPDNMVAEFRQAGADLHYVDKQALSPWRFFQAMRSVVREVRPDVIHCWQASPAGWGRLAGRAAGCRRFICGERTGNVLGCYGWGSRQLERALGRRTIWTANTHAVAEAVAKALPVDLGRIRVIHNAVEMPARDRRADRIDVRRELGLREDQPLVLSVGRQTRAKNYPMLFRAAKRVLASHPDARFLVAGHGEEEPALRAMLKEMDLGEGVRMLGLRGDVPRLLHAADVFCLCSLWEGFPNMMAEAMSVGLPVVTTDFPGAEEVCLPGQTALVVARNDDPALAAAILGLLKDPLRRQEMAEAGRSRVKEQFSWDRLLGQMRSLYGDCMAMR